MRRVAGSSPYSTRNLFQLSAQVTNGAIETKSEVATSNKHIASPNLLLPHVECATAAASLKHVTLLRASVLFTTPQTKLRSH